MTRPGSPASSAPVALGGIAVLLVLVQSTGAVPAELLGPDVLLAVAGFRVTQALLGGARATGGLRLAAWYRDQFLLRAPLLLLSLAVVLAVVAAVGTAQQAAAAGADAVAGAAGAGNWWDLVTALPSWGPHLDALGQQFGLGLGTDWYAERAGRVDPLGLLWLVGLLVQLAVVWPLLLAPLRRAVTADRRPMALVPVLVLLAAAAALVGPLRAAGGASAAELALGTHVRAAEWLLGAAAAAFVVARQGRGAPAWVGTALTAIAPPVLVATAVFATTAPDQWLRFGGPAAAALATAVLLVAVHAPSDGPLATMLGRGLPLELGRVAYPLLLLHLPVFWLVQLAVPTARPFALLVVGGALAWLLALVLQDGLVRRAARRRAATTAVVVLLAVAVVAAGLALDRTAPEPAGRRPVVLVVGGAEAGDIADALAGLGRHTVVDGSRPGCGLLPPAAPVTAARTSSRAQLPTAPAPVCGDRVQYWRTQVAAAAPDAIVVDLSVDAAPRADPLEPCDAGFRARYRPLLDRAVAAWTTGAPDRPVLVADGPTATRSGRCLDALLAEAVAARGALVPLAVQALLCENKGAESCDGSGTVALRGAQRDAVARFVDDKVAVELTPERAAARGQERASNCGGAVDAVSGGAGSGGAGC